MSLLPYVSLAILYCLLPNELHIIYRNLPSEKTVHKIRTKLRRKQMLKTTEKDDSLPKFTDRLPSHKKKETSKLCVGLYSDENLDTWAELIKAGVCTYEGIASVYQVSIGSLYKRYVKTVPGTHT